MADFCEATGVDADDPRRILSDYQHEWTQHKCRRIASFARLYSSIVREKLPRCVIGAYLCPWSPLEWNGALSRIFAQSYPMLAPFIDVFTPLIYAQKSGRGPDWGARFLNEAPGFVPADRKVLLILDVLDFPDGLTQTAASQVPSWGLQLYGGAEVFSDPAKAQVFSEAAAAVRAVAAGGSRA